MIRKYGKAVAALLAAALTAVASAITDSHVTAPEVVQIAIAVTTAAGVWLVPDLPSWPAVKTALAVLLAVLNGLVTVVLDGVTTAEMVNLALVALGVLGVAAAPATSTAATRSPADAS